MAETLHLVASVVDVVRRYREGTVVLLDTTATGSKGVWVPTWEVAKGDLVDGFFQPNRNLWVPVKPELVRVYPSGDPPMKRELGQVIYTVVPAMGYQRSLALGRRENAFDHLLMRKPLDGLFVPHEIRERKEAEEGLRGWRWFFEGLQELVSLGFTPMEGYRILEALGEPGVALAQEKPFLLAQVEGVEYLRLVSRFRRKDPAGELVQRLKEVYGSQGSTLAHYKEVLGPKADMAEVERLVEASLGQVFWQGEWLGLARYVDLEMELWENARERSSLPLLPPPPGLGEDQAKAITLLEHRVGILTGGPGTGKTYTLSRMVQAAREAGIPVVLMAPTGKAARRMEELAGTEARTLHGALGIKPHEGFASPSNLPRGLVILDEASMLSLEDAVSAVRALPAGASLLLVGDVDQLPPVQPGQPFADLLGRTVTVRLVSVRRQKNPRAVLLEAARATLEGVPWKEVVRGEPEDFLYVRAKSPAEAVRWVRFFSEYYLVGGFSIEDFQVLTPVHGGPLGTQALNGVLRQIVPRRTSMGVQLGDGHMAFAGEKIIFNENRFLLKVANGTMGILEEISENILLVRSGKDYLEVPKGVSHLVSLGYAITVHRSQGSEWRAVILVLPETHLLTRKLVYTGLTRAREQVVVITTEDLLRKPPRQDPRRQTWLNTLAQ